MTEKLVLQIVVLAVCIFFTADLHADLKKEINGFYDSKSAYYENLYKSFHSEPELSFNEVKTSEKIARELTRLGFKVTKHIGKTGVVGVLKNGDGPVGLIRTDMDALPIEENTGLDFSSKHSGVMHACGHDVHMTSFVAAADLMVKLKKRWKGTLVMVAQPAEETLEGAQAMIADGLFKIIPKPDYALGFHIRPGLASSQVQYRAGLAYAAHDGFNITFNGRGGHAAYPQRTVDPIAMLIKFVSKLDSLSSAPNVKPENKILVNVGMIKTGTKRSIIPDTAYVEGSVRTYDEFAREDLRNKVRDLAKNIANEAKAPEPKITFVEANGITVNQADLAKQVVPAFKEQVGEALVTEGGPIVASEDFGVFGKLGQFSSLYFWVGAEKVSTKEHDNLHSSIFKPDFKTAIATATKAMVSGAIFLQNNKTK